VFSLLGVASPSLLIHGGVELDHTDDMQEHLQNLVSQGYMMVVDFTTCRVPEDPASPIQVGGYIVVCAAFHEQGFGVQLHWFLCLLLQFHECPWAMWTSLCDLGLELIPTFTS
jgi:hypothetical protein